MALILCVKHVKRNQTMNDTLKIKIKSVRKKLNTIA